VSAARSAFSGTLASNQLVPNVALKRDEKTLIDLVDGLSSGSIVLVGVMDGDFRKMIFLAGVGTWKLSIYIEL
jgi:hypothetical protein